MAKWISIWLRGRKTYLLATLVALVAVLLVALGRLTPETALAVLVFAVPAFAVTFRSAIRTHSQEILAILAATAAVGVELRRHDTATAEKVGMQVIQDGIKLANEMKAEGVE